MPQAFKSLILGGVNGNTAILTSLPNNISFGSWSTVPVMLVQLLIVGTAIIVFFQATILIFVRGLTLTLCMIFSPLMLLPAGINKYLDKYRDMVITYFTNSTIMAPIFFFLVLIAFQIGATASQLTSSASITLAGDTSGVIGAALSGVIVIIVLEIALTTAKNLSGQIGTAVSGKISGVMGNVAFGGAGKIARLGMNKVATSKRLNK